MQWGKALRYFHGGREKTLRCLLIGKVFCACTGQDFEVLARVQRFEYLLWGKASEVLARRKGFECLHRVSLLLLIIRNPCVKAYLQLKKKKKITMS